MKRFLFALCALLALLGAPQGFAQRETYSRAESVSLAQLPPEVRRTVALIRANGPFPYSRDGIVFGNREAQLPKQHRGYYHEYTVPTPGARNRGARRIIAGERGELYYTDDHYQTFRRIRE